MIKEIKYNRMYNKLDEILNQCWTVNDNDNHCVYIISGSDTLYTMFSLENNKVYSILYYNFIKHGMCKDLTHDDVVNYINNKFN